MAEDLHELCHQFGKETTSDGTHVVFADPLTNYVISKQNMTELYTTYAAMVDDGVQGLTLAERPKDIMPVIFKLNLRFDTDEDEPYDETFILRFVYYAQKVLVQHLELKELAKELHCIVLESENYNQDGYEHDDHHYRGFMSLRFQFPYCRVETEVQQKTLIPNLIRILRAKSMKSEKNGMFGEPIGDWDTIIDTAYITRPVPMFGSKEGPEEAMMEFKYVIGPIRERDLENTNYNGEVGLSEVFKTKHHSFVSRGIISGDVFDNDMEMSYWLPIIMSVDYGLTEVLPRRQARNSPGNRYSPKKKFDISNFGRGGDLEEMTKMEVAPIFLEMWNPKRFVTKEHWLYVGEALFDADDGGEEGLATWILWMRNAIQNLDIDLPEFLKGGIEISCENEYYTFRLDRTTVKTLAWYARLDNPDKYKEWHDSWSRRAMEIAVSGLDTDVGRAFYRIYWLEAMCTYATSKRVIWYIFDKNRLRQNPNGYRMSQLMTTDFYKRFCIMLADVANFLAQAKTDKEKEHGEDIIDKIKKLLKNLKTRTRKLSYLAEAADSFVHDDLESLLDSNPEIMGIPNGVLVATTERVTIRSGRPEDYITRSIKTPYRKDLSYDHPDVIAIEKWMMQTFIDPDLVNHWKKMLASLLRGGNNDKLINAISGAGDNSKSMWVKIIETVLGPYCAKIPMGLLTHGRGDAQSATPATSRMEGCHLVVFEEPEKGVPLKGGVAKLIAGNDKAYTRRLHQEGHEFVPMHKTWIISNTVPRFDEPEKALVNRLQVMPCIGTFSEKAPKDEEEQFESRTFPLDIFFDTKVPRLAVALFWIMVKSYPMYLREGLRKEPKIIKEYTQKYWEDTDIYFQFKHEKIETHYDEDGNLDVDVRIDLDTVYDAFKEWFDHSFPSRKREVPDRPTVRVELSTRWGPPTLGEWPGYSLKYHGGDAYKTKK